MAFLARFTSAFILAFSLLALALLGVAVGTRGHGDTLAVHFLDVGQGDAIFIETPGGRQVLIDGGREGSGVVSGLAEFTPFWDRTLDMVVATHMDGDHIGGLIEVLDAYRVERIVVGTTRGESDLAGAFWSRVDEEDAEVVFAGRGVDFILDEEVFLHTLSPTSELLGSSDNDASLVFKLVYRNDSFLLTGDMEKRAEYALLAAGTDVDADVLKVAHHGSNTSSVPAFLQAVSPHLAVIQVGKNSYGHPNEQVLGRLRGVPTFRNDTNGTVSLYSRGDSF